MILRSGRTVRLEAPFGGSGSRATGSTSGGETLGTGAVGIAAPAVDSADAEETSALPSPGPLPRRRDPLRTFASLTARRCRCRAPAVMVRPWPLNHAATSRHA